MTLIVQLPAQLPRKLQYFQVLASRIRARITPGNTNTPAPPARISAHPSLRTAAAVAPLAAWVLRIHDAQPARAQVVPRHGLNRSPNVSPVSMRGPRSHLRRADMKTVVHGARAGASGAGHWWSGGCSRRPSVYAYDLSSTLMMLTSSSAALAVSATRRPMRRARLNPRTARYPPNTIAPQNKNIYSVPATPFVGVGRARQS